MCRLYGESSPTISVTETKTSLRCWLSGEYFGNQMFGGLDDIVWTNIDILTLRCDFDLEYSNPIFSYGTLAYDYVSSDCVWLPKNQQFSRYNIKSYSDHISPRCDLDLEDSTQFFF